MQWCPALFACMRGGGGITECTLIYMYCACIVASSTFGQRAPLMVRLQSGHAQCDVPPALSPWQLSSSEAASDKSIIER